MALNYILDQMDLFEYTYIQGLNPKKQNVHLSEMYVEHFQR